MKVTKIHNIISFKQKPWMAPYIEGNIENRNKAKKNKESFGDTIFKLLNNAVFGKTMENIDKYRDIRLYTDSPEDLKTYKKVISKPTFAGQADFGEHLKAVEVGCYEKIYNKPIYLGFAILELSKLQMYETYYDVLLPHFGDRITLHYMDTDSFIVHIKSEDVDEEMKGLDKIFNTSSKLFSYKDERPGNPINEVILNRAKQYSILTVNPYGDNIRNKGIQKCVTKKMTHQMYLDCLLTDKKRFDTVHAIRSEDHDVFLMEQVKVSLNNYDDKRFILSDGITTLPYGHYIIKYIKNLDSINKKRGTNYTDLDIYKLFSQQYQ